MKADFALVPVRSIAALFMVRFILTRKLSVFFNEIFVKIWKFKMTVQYVYAHGYSFRSFSWNSKIRNGETQNNRLKLVITIVVRNIILDGWWIWLFMNRFISLNWCFWGRWLRGLWSIKVRTNGSKIETNIVIYKSRW